MASPHVDPASSRICVATVFAATDAIVEKIANMSRTGRAGEAGKQRRGASRE